MRKQTLKLYCQTMCITLIVMLSPLKVMAHPHSWISMRTQVDGDEQHITGFHMIWTFDAMTTAYLFDGEDMSKAHRAATLKKLAKDVIDNMAKSDYFTYFYQGKSHLKYQNVPEAQLTESHGKATLSFHLQLAKPVKLAGEPLRLLIYDPTYYVDMSWDDHKDVTLAPSLARICKQRIVEPHPTPAQISYAMSIPIDASPDNTLGQAFTQSLVLNCQPSH